MKKEKGFTTIDISIAMMVIAIFVGIMSSMMYSVYLSTTEAKRTATALNYAVDIFENIGRTDFSRVYAEGVLRDLSTDLGIKSISSTTTSTADIATGKIGTYDIHLEVTKPYVDGKIKKFKLTITYKVSAKNTETLVLERIKTIS